MINKTHQKILFTENFLQRKMSLMRMLQLFFLYARVSVSAFLLSLLFALSAKANAGDPKQLLNKITSLESEYLNSIEILDNRFRIDNDVESVTLLFFREFGSAPIVLVRPDGSKLFLENDDEDDSYTWFETDKYDMISLDNPMPGPWQAVGDILPGSRVLVIAGITLDAQDIPSTVFSGEIIKQTARLENQGSAIDMSLFKDVVSLSIEFVSTNNPDYPNFGLGSRSVARFRDNGQGYDEVNGDGIFTGQFDLQITEGEWRPVFTVRTPLFSREQVNDIVMLLPTPITIKHVEALELEQQHQVLVNAMPQYIEPASLIIDGMVRHPNGDQQRFSFTDTSTQAENFTRQISITNSNYGIYKIEMMAYAKTKTGRDIVLSVPEYSFATKAPIVESIPVEAENEALNEMIDNETSLQQEVVEEQSTSYILWAVVVNVFLLIVGCIVILLLVKKRNRAHMQSASKLEVNNSEELASAEKPETKNKVAQIFTKIAQAIKLKKSPNEDKVEPVANT